MRSVTPLVAMGRSRVLPVLVLDDVRHAVAVATALRAGGLPIAEVTLRSRYALEVLREMSSVDDVMVGAGTVTRPEQVERVLAAGGRFAVSPGFSPGLVRECHRQGLPILPGVATPTELQAALDAGVDTVKFFPAAASGGVRMVRAMSAPFPHVRMVPTGGITAAGMSEYLALPTVLAVGGTWLAPAEWVCAGRYDLVELAARDASKRVLEEVSV
ncbi:bifunctional 4-hydroxy-2-oxoglutarate aldolase/2-dehydro-3-deoxy-phosphogluconate aldolase [Nocardioides acrostichi]|nr:bifunctional 4-hydroxy-2-oxoglutarate aldolase/2-dehydro-3-deoxy-phosphogluconate aldolase [Nocardioides acrostichi]